MLHVKPTLLSEQFAGRVPSGVLLKDHNVIRALRFPVVQRELKTIEEDLPDATVQWIGSIPSRHLGQVKVSIVVSNANHSASLIVEYRTDINQVQSISKQFGKRVIATDADSVPFALLSPSLTEAVALSDDDERLRNVRARRDEFTRRLAGTLPITMSATYSDTTSQTGDPSADPTPYPTSGVTTPNDNDTQSDERADTSTDYHDDTVTDSTNDDDGD